MLRASHLLAQRAAAAPSSAAMSTIPTITDKQVIAVMGGQWGDEGKGKLVDSLGMHYDVTARCAGGSNAGHTVVVNGVKYAFHLMPSAILHEGHKCVIGNGVVLHLPTLFKEIANLEKQGIDHEGRILISNRAHLLFDIHQAVDGQQEDALSDKTRIGTTRRGIGPAYAAKANRIGVRVCDLDFPDEFHTRLSAMAETYKRSHGVSLDVDKEVDTYMQYYERVKPMVVDSVDYINSAVTNGKRVMIEGANATMLDIDFGTYPFVTSSNSSIGGACTGLGLSPTRIDAVVGVMKAYGTRVGAGPMPTELNDDVGQAMRDVGHEYGTTTGRPRRCGWVDGVAMKYVSTINNFDAINITKLDVLSNLKEVKMCVAYKYKGSELTTHPASLRVLEECEPVYKTFKGWNEDISKARDMADLPEAAADFVKAIEEACGVPAKWIGVGVGREDMIVR